MGKKTKERTPKGNPQIPAVPKWPLSRREEESKTPCSGDRSVKQKEGYKTQWVNGQADGGWGKGKARVSTPQGSKIHQRYPRTLSQKEHKLVMCAEIRMCRRRTSSPKMTGQGSRVIGPKGEGRTRVHCRGSSELYKLVSCHRKFAPRRKVERKAVTSSMSCFWSKRRKRRSKVMEATLTDQPGTHWRASPFGRSRDRPEG